MFIAVVETISIRTRRRIERRKRESPNKNPPLLFGGALVLYEDHRARTGFWSHTKARTQLGRIIEATHAHTTNPSPQISLARTPSSAKQARIAIAVLMITVPKDHMTRSLAQSLGGPLGHYIDGRTP